MGDGKGNVDQDRTVGMAGYAETSRLAFATTPDRVRTSQRERIEEFVKAAGDRGATADEIETTLKLPHQSSSARVRDLVASGRIHFWKETRRTSRNKEARVYYAGAAPAGQVVEEKRTIGLGTAKLAKCVRVAREALENYREAKNPLMLVNALEHLLLQAGENPPPREQKMKQETLL